MSITVVSATASPSTVAPGATSTITPDLTDPDNTSTITVQADGTKATVQIITHEPEVYSVNPADIGTTGKVVATVDQGGTLSVGPNGTFIFTAS